MTIEQFLTETARLQLCTALLEQLKTETGREAIVMAIPDLVKHTLAEQRSYRYGNTEVNAIEAMFHSLFEDEKLKAALREAVTRFAKRDERWEVVLDGLIGDEQTKPVALALMKELGIDFYKSDQAIAAALELLHRTGREYLVSRHFGSVEVMITHVQQRHELHDRRFYERSDYVDGVGYSHSHGGRYAMQETIEITALMRRKVKELSPNETMRMLYQQLNEAGRTIPNTMLGDSIEIERTIASNELPPIPSPELCGCGHGVHDGACNARDCACKMDLRRAPPK